MSVPPFELFTTTVEIPAQLVSFHSSDVKFSSVGIFAQHLVMSYHFLFSLSLIETL